MTTKFLLILMFLCVITVVQAKEETMDSTEAELKTESEAQNATSKAMVATATQWPAYVNSFSLNQSYTMPVGSK